MTYYNKLAIEEAQCLHAFNFLKDSIIYILKEDIAKKEELALRKKLEIEIASFNP